MILQFLIFFLVGLGIFLSVGTFFRAQMDIYAEDISGANKNTIAGFVGAHMVSQFAECKKCDNVVSTFKIQNTTANFDIEILLNGSGVSVITHPGEKGVISSLHNLNYSISELSGSAILREQIK